MLKEKKGTQIILDSKQDFRQNILEILKTSKISRKPYTTKSVNPLYLSYVKTFKWVLEQSNDKNDLNKLKRIILIKIRQLKKEKKKAVYRIETIRIIEEIDKLEFCLNAIVSSRYK